MVKFTKRFNCHASGGEIVVHYHGDNSDGDTLHVQMMGGQFDEKELIIEGNFELHEFIEAMHRVRDSIPNFDYRWISETESPF